MTTYNILHYGAVGDGTTYDTHAIQRTIDACHEAGGGTVLVPAGKTYLSGTIRLKSYVTFHVEGGARIIGGGKREDYPNEALRCLVEAEDAESIAVTGMGQIDGQDKLHMVEDLKYIYRGTVWRPRLMGLIRCRRVTIRDITLKNSANWGLHLTGCEDVVIHGIRILNDLKVPNCDGIDPDHCRNVRISDCHIEAGDDCIVIKNTKEFADCGPSENITVTGCTCISTSAAIKIGTESVDDFRNIVVDACVIQGSSRGLAIQLRDQGNVENVLFSNCVVETRLFDDHWWGKAEPIYVTAIHRFAHVGVAGAEQAGLEDLTRTSADLSPFQYPAWNPTGALGQIRHVRFSNILCRSENGVFIAGAGPRRGPDGEAGFQHHIQDVVLDNIRVEVDKWSKWPGGIHDRRPCDALGPAFRDPSHDPGLKAHRTAGVFVEHAKDVVLRHVQVVWGANRPDYFGHALEAHDAPGLELDGFKGEAAHADKDAPMLRV